MLSQGSAFYSFAENARNLATKGGITDINCRAMQVVE